MMRVDTVLPDNVFSPAESAPSKSAHVKVVFEDSKRYLDHRGVDIRLRREFVQSFAARCAWSTLLDIGCGDGTISLPLLRPGVRLTLLDLSASMTQLARQNTPPALADQVVICNQDFMQSTLETAPFDLVITVGVLAHVDSLCDFLAKVRQTLRPGGHLIIEFTDCHHAIGRVGAFFDRLKECVAPARYPTNKLSREQVFPVFAENRLSPVATFRYARVPLPVLPRLLGADLHYRLVNRIFGSVRDNSNAGLGNEYLCLLRRDE